MALSAGLLTEEMETELATTKRRMLRIISSTKRGPEESWIECFQRATAKVENQMEELGGESSVTCSRRKSLRSAGNTARETDHRWSNRLLMWKPHFRCTLSRDGGHPCRRLEDSILAVAGGNWTKEATDKTLWSLLEHGYTTLSRAEQ